MYVISVSLEAAFNARHREQQRSFLPLPMLIRRGITLTFGNTG